MLFPDDENIFRDKKKHDFKRLTASYENKSEKFHLTETNFSKQFAHIYSSRLAEFTKLLEPQVREKWGKIPIKKLCDLKEEDPGKCVVIGTIYKHQEFKPSILREISEENQLAPQPPRLKYTDEKDVLILEDELQRVKLIGNVESQNMVTGVVCGALGYIGTGGIFEVEEIMFYESPQKSLTPLSDSPLLVIVSGLGLSSSNDVTMSLELFQQWIFGNIEDINGEHDYEAASIVRVIIAGNSIRTETETKQKSLLTRQPESANTLDAVKYCDRICSQLSKSVNVDLMPGEFDPSNFLLPQQPMHQCIFPNSRSTKNFQSVTNPYECEINNRTVLGTSGQNVIDIMRVTNIDRPIEALKSTLTWSHITPTSPDTLPCYPYAEKDPFIVKNCPHVYFAGNQGKFETEIFKSNNGHITRLICVPSFNKTQSIVVVNLRTLDCRSLSFQINEVEE